MFDVHRFLNFTAIQLILVVLLFSLGILCLGITFQDYVHGRTVITTGSKDMNEAILTCVMLTGITSLGYGVMKLRTLFYDSIRTDINHEYQGQTTTK